MLKTEMRNPKTTHIDKMSPLEIARVMNEENAYCVRAVEAELNAIKPKDKIFTSEGTAEVYANSLDGLLGWA